MESAAWHTVQESELRRYLRGARPHWRASDLAAAENKLRRVGIDGPETLVAALASERHAPDRIVLDAMFELEDLAPFEQATIDSLRLQAERPLPKPRTVVQARDLAAVAIEQEAAPEASPFARFFEGEGDDAEEPQEKLSLAEQRKRFAEKSRPQNATTLREKRLEAARRMGAERARAEFEASWREPELNEEDETFQVLVIVSGLVVHSMAFIKEAPSTDAPDLGVVRKGEIVQVRPRRVQDSDGHDWVELTYLELLRSCNASAGTVLAGYVLIDGTHLGLGPLLCGPMTGTRPGGGEAGSEVQEETSKDPPAPEDRAAEAAKQEAARPAEKSEAAAAQAPSRETTPSQAPAGPRPDAAPAQPVRAPKPKASSGKAPKLIPHTFRVSHREGASVREGPSARELQISLAADGELLELEEETFDGWAKLAGAEGWVRRCALEGGAVVTYLAPIGKPLPLFATTEVLGEPGPRQFEVVMRPRVAVKAAPRPTAKLLRNVNFGERVLALTQTYDGWVRLAGGEGWALGIGRESGQLLR